MADAGYDILFSGELERGADRDAVRSRIQALFKLTDQAANQLFSGRTITVKRNVDAARAARLKEVFLEAGALVQVKECGKTEPATPGSPAGSEPGGSRLGLAPVDGTPLEAEPDTLPPALDVGHLSLVPGADWTLEDCDRPAAPIPAPDIGHLQIVELEPAGNRPEWPDT